MRDEHSRQMHRTVTVYKKHTALLHIFHKHHKVLNPGS